MTKPEELRQERAKLITKMRELNEAAEKEKRDLNTEERASYDKLKVEVTGLKERYERIEEQEKLERELQGSQGTIGKPHVAARGDKEEKEEEKVEEKPKELRARPEYKRAFESYIRYGSTAQLRALEAGTDSEGGYTVPLDTASDVVQALARLSVVRRAGARVMVVSRDTDIPIASIVTGTWEPEEDPFGNNQDTDPVFTVFQARSHKYTVGTKASRELLADAVVDIDALLRQLFVDAWVLASDDAYVNGAGAGSNQPTGVLDGGTIRQLASGSTTSFTATQLRTHFFALPQQYRRDPSTAWIVSDEVISSIAALTADSNNEFLWVPGLREGETDRLMGKPLFSSTAVESLAASNKVAVVGAFRFYQIVDRLNQAGVRRLDELFATTGQVGFIGSWRTDGGVLVADAFRVMQMADS